MSRKLLFPALLLAVSCSTDRPDESPFAPQLAKDGPQQSVHGRIYIDFFDEKDTFSAIRHADGSVTGEFNVHNPSEGHIRGRVVCFTIDGNVARLAGVIERADDLPALVGGGALWTVQDNGEGSNDPDDLASDIRYGVSAAFAASHCVVPVLPPYDVQQKANIQINE